MNRFVKSLAIGALAAIVPLSIVAAAPSGKATSATFHVTQNFMHDTHVMHAMGGAKLRYTKGDVFINVTIEHLAAPSTLGKRAYVVFATDGAMSDRVGALKTTGQMSTVSGEVMMTKVQDLYVYAVNASNVKHVSASTKPILSAMVG